MKPEDQPKARDAQQERTLCAVVLVGLVVSVAYFVLLPIQCEACHPAIPPNCAFGQAPFIAVSYYAHSFKSRPQVCFPIDSQVYLSVLPASVTLASFIRLADGAYTAAYGATTPDYIFVFWVYSTCVTLALDLMILRLSNPMDKSCWKIFLMVKLGAALAWLFILCHSPGNPIGYYHAINLFTSLWTFWFSLLACLGELVLSLALIFFTLVDWVNFVACLVVLILCCGIHQLGRFLPWGSCEPPLIDI